MRAFNTRKGCRQVRAVFPPAFPSARNHFNLIAAERFDATIDSITFVSAQHPSLSATCALASGDKGACCGSRRVHVPDPQDDSDAQESAGD